PIAGLGHRDASRGAIEEANAEPFLERTDRLAHGRKGNAHLRRRFREAAMLGHAHKGGQFGELDACHSSIIPYTPFGLFCLIKMATTSQVSFVRASPLPPCC